MKAKTKKIVGGAIAGAVALSTVFTGLNPFTADDAAKTEQLVISSRSENAGDYVHWAERKFKEKTDDTTPASAEENKSVTDGNNSLKTSVKPEGETSKSEGETSKVEGEASKTEGETSKTDGETSKTEGETSKSEGETSKVEGEASKTEGETSKANGEASKTEGETSKSEAEVQSVAAPAADTEWVWDDGALLFPTILELNGGDRDSVYCLQYSKKAPTGVELANPSEDGISLKTYGILKNGFNQKTGKALGELTNDESYWVTHAAIIISENWEPDGSESWALKDFDLSMDPEADGDAIPVPNSELADGEVVAKNAEKAAATRNEVEKLLQAGEATTEKDYFRLNGASASVKKENGTYIAGPYLIETNLKDTPKVELTNAPAGATYAINGDAVTVTIPEASVTKSAEFSVKVSMDSELFIAEKWQSNNSDVQEVVTCDTKAAEAVADVIINPEKEGIITLNKVDAEGKKLKDVEFTIYNESGNVVEVIKTDDKGIAKSSKLPLGKYTVKETKAAEGYSLLKESLAITLSESGTSIVTEVEKTVVNTQTKVVIKKVEKDNSKKVLEGAVLRVEKENGTVVAKGETDRNGEITVKGLAAGKYYIIEEEAPEGYKITKDKVSFTLNEYGEVSGSTTIENEEISVTITKVDSADKNKKLEGATIEIRNSSNKVVYVGKTNSKGEITATKLAPGKYTAKETKAPDGYKLNSDSISFEVEKDGDVDGETTIENTKTVVTIVKKDKESGDKLSGAKIIIKNESGKEVFSGTTDKDGKVTISGLASGKYVYYEAEAPEGYILTNEKSTFTINKDGEDLELTLYNTKIDAETLKATTTNNKTNDKGSDNEIIKTGVEEESKTNMIPFVLVGAALICGAIAAVVVFSKKKKTDKSE